MEGSFVHAIIIDYLLHIGSTAKGHWDTMLGKIVIVLSLIVSTLRKTGEKLYAACAVKGSLGCST